MKLDDKGRCPNCLRKPIPYKRDKHWFCHTCCRQYAMADGEQQDNWAWELIEGVWTPKYKDSGTADYYGRAKPTDAAIRKAEASNLLKSRAS